MIRSLVAVILAVICGLAATKMLESGLAQMVMATPSTPSYGVVLLASWFVGAFIAAFIALLLGRRWAPVGAIGASSIFLSAMLALGAASLSWMLWPGAIAVTTSGGYAAIKLLKAGYAYPAQPRKGGLLDE